MSRLFSSLALLAALAAPSAAYAQVPTVSDMWRALPDSAVLLDAGAEPRRALRYDFSALEPGAVLIAMSLQAQMTFDGVPPTGNTLPVIAAVNRITRVELISHALVRLHFSLSGFEVQDAPGVEPYVIEQMRTLTAPLEGVSGHVLMTDRGVLREYQLDLSAVPEATVASLGDLLENFRAVVVPLPDEAVGRGARYAVAADVHTAGYDARQTTIYTVTELSEAGATLTATQSYTAPSQAQEVGANLVSMLGDGALTLSLQFNAPMSSGTLSSEIGLRLLVGQGGGRGASLAQTTTLTVTTTE